MVGLDQVGELMWRGEDRLGRRGYGVIILCNCLCMMIECFGVGIGCGVVCFFVL